MGIGSDNGRDGEGRRGGRGGQYRGAGDGGANGKVAIHPFGVGGAGKGRGWKEQRRFPEVASLVRLVVGVSL